MTPKQFLQEKKIITEFIQVQSFTERNGFALIPLSQLLTDYHKSIQLMQTDVMRCFPAKTVEDVEEWCKQQLTRSVNK
jgi:hypothetical protein